jgi:hypothetical protein
MDSTYEEEGCRIQWTDEMLSYLLQCRNEAKEEQQSIAATGRNASYLSIMLRLWNRRFSHLNLTSGNLQSRLYVHEHPSQKKKRKKRSLPVKATAAFPQTSQVVASCKEKKKKP